MPAIIPDNINFVSQAPDTYSAGIHAERDTLLKENAALKEQVAQLQAACISGFYYERVPQFRQGFPNHEVLELVTAKEVQAYVDRVETLQSKSAALVDALKEVDYYFDGKGDSTPTFVLKALAAFKGEK